MLKSFADLKSAMPRAPQVLADLTQPRMQAQHPGARRVYMRPAPFDPHALYMSEGSVNMARTWPEIGQHHPQLVDRDPKAPAKAPQRVRRVAEGKGRRNEKRLYAPVNGHCEGEHVLFIDKLTGQVLARCVGSREHVVGEAIKFALAAGGSVADLAVVRDKSAQD